MTGVLTALGTMSAIVALGYLLGRFRVLGEDATPVLARITFAVAIPALLIVTIAHADLHLLISRIALVTALSTTAVAVVAAVVLRLVLRRPAGETAIGTLAASYLNAAHLGIPVAVYVVGDAVAAVPTLLFQQLFLAPSAFAVLGAGRGVRHALRRTVRNPIIVAALTGLLLAALPPLPEVVYEPFAVVGAAAAPLALVAFGMALAARREGTAHAPVPDLTLVAVLRAVAHPVLAWLAAGLVGLDAAATLAVVTMASLPTAQNVLVFALQYRRGVALARDAGLVTTALAVPVMLVVAATLG